MVAYRTYARRLSERTFTPSGPRPSGTLVWIHAPELSSLLAIQDLAQRLATLRTDLSVLITVPDTTAFKKATAMGLGTDQIHLEIAPSEHPAAVGAFWEHWSPSIGIWAWGALRPNLVIKARDMGCTLALIDADAEGFDNTRDKWMPELTRHLLEPFVILMVRSGAGVQRLQKLGLPSSRIDQTPPLQAGGSALPCDETDLNELTEALGARSAWLAVNVQTEELGMILDAHRQALRLSHRLLLILQPAMPELATVFETELSDRAMRVGNWAEGDIPEDSMQVLVAPDTADLGLFYRMAPVVLMGSSLLPGYTGRNPYEAAALGSAVLYGPHTGPFVAFYSALAAAGAARVVKDAETLQAAVSLMISPDHAAAMAHAGWDIISRGARLTDRVIDLVQAVLDDDLRTWHARA